MNENSNNVNNNGMNQVNGFRTPIDLESTNNNFVQESVLNGNVMGNANNMSSMSNDFSNNQYAQMNSMNASASQVNSVGYNSLGAQTNYNSLENTQVLGNLESDAKGQMEATFQSGLQNNNLNTTSEQVQTNSNQVQNVVNADEVNLNQVQNNFEQGMMQNGGVFQTGAQGDVGNQINSQMSSQTVLNNDGSSLSVDANEVVSKKKKSKLPLILIILVVLALIGFGIYYFVNSSRNMFVVAVDKIFNYLEESTINNATSSGTFSLKVNLSDGDGSTNKSLDIINNIDLSGNYSIDYENKLASLDIDSNYKDKELIDVDVYMDSGNGYVLLEGLYDKYIRIFIENYDAMFSNYSNKDDYRVVISSINGAVKDSLKDEYFIKEKVDFNGNKVDKTVLDLNYSNYGTIKKDIYDKLVNDEKFLNSFAAIGKMSVNEVKQGLEKFKELDSDYETLNIVLFTKGTSFVGLELSNSSNKVVVSRDNDVYDFEISEYSDIVLDGSVKLLEDNKVVVNLGVPEENSSIEVTISSIVNYGTKFEKKDVSNNISSEEITEEDSDNITNNLLKKDGFVSLFQDVYAVSDADSIDSHFGI